MSVSHVQQGGGFVQEHLPHWQLNLHNFTFTNGGFWTLNLDTLAVSIFWGIVILGVFYWIARRAVSDKPGFWQNLLEIVVTFSKQSMREAFQGKSILVGPLALIIFVWIFVLSFMDLLPVDLVPGFMHFFGIEHFRAVPTDDPNLTFAMSITVFGLIILYNLGSKGLRGLLKEICCVPFGAWLFPANIFFRLLEEIVKPISLSLRLFGNIFAGELIFVLIALTPWYVQWTLGGIWSIFHVLVIVIQSYIFMMLTIVYLNMAHRGHD